ncbi:MAG: hypothetical protein U0835_02120 [Isosphaeraceae bacterium]
MPRSTWIRAFVVAAAALLPFVRCLPNPWIWDDQLLLAKRLDPAKGVGPLDVWGQPYWGDVGPADTYRPLALSLIALERRAFGEAVAPYHAVSLALHAAVSLLVMAVFGRLAGARLGWLTALLFAVHPVHAEAVAMVYGQLELVSALFVLLTVGLYERSRRDGVRPAPFALAVACAFAAACSKESALVLPALLLLVRAAWMSDRGNAEGRARAPARRFVRGLGWDLLFWVVPLLYLGLRYRALGTLAPDAEATVTLGYSFGQRVKTVIVSLAHALRLCTFPTGQGLYYGHLRDSVFGRPANELLWLVAAGIAGRSLARELGGRRFGFAAGWFLLTFLPVSNILPTGVLVAERTLYLPSLGVCFLLASLYERLAESVASPRLLRGAFAALLVVAAAAGFRLVGDWHDEETFWRATVSTHPGSPMGHLGLGHALLKRGEGSKSSGTPQELTEAAAAFAEAYRLNPTLTQALIGGGIVAAKRGDRAGAERLLRQAVESAPDDPEAQAALRSFLESPPAPAGAAPPDGPH